tara:strand:- start:1484 stop:1906 length:423 start_codon:yes stop_codon:yes gene_type:complete
MNSKKIFLIIGIAGSGKSTLAKYLSKKLNANWLNADKVRTKFDDWDFSDEGIVRQSKRMKKLSKVCKKKNVVIDLICPFEEGRKIINADYTIWVDTIKKSRFKKIRLEKKFEKPKKYDVRVTSKNYLLWSKKILDILKKI